MVVRELAVTEIREVLYDRPSRTADADGDDRVICVMCGTRLDRTRQHANAARELGRNLAALSLTVLYGGGKTGLMGTLADAALAGGGRVEGVMPPALLDYGIEHKGPCE